MVKVNNRITIPTDAIQSREPSTMQQSVMNEELIRKLNSEQARKKAREEYRKANILRPGILTISDEDIDKAIVAQEASKPTNLVQDNRTEKQRKASKKEFDKRYQDEQEKKRLDQVDEIMSSSTDYIPIVGSLLRAGQYNYARDHLGWKYANNRYGLSPMISSALDVATIPFGIGVKALASSYAGGMAGKYVGDKYFNNPHVGQFIGTLVGHPTYNVASKASKEFQFKNILNQGIKRTKLINVPVEHVSSNGITEESGLNAASLTDVGFHFSPVGSRTTFNIQRAIRAPFVRTGTWTYSTNTKPVIALDKGNWTYNFNPELYKGLNPGNTPSENALALNQRNPNYTYINNFEGQGGRSYMTTEPNFGLVLSKNREASPKIILNRAQSVHHPTSPDGREYYTNGQLMAEGASPITLDANIFGAPVYRLQGDLYERAVKPFVDDVRQMYNSDWYANRLILHGFSPKQIASIQSRVNNNIDRTNYFITEEALPEGWIGGSGFDKSTGLYGVALNGKFQNHPSYNTIIHETGHTAEHGIDEINKTNKILADVISKNIDYKYLTPQEIEDLNYFLRIYDDNSTELGGQIRNALVSMYKNNQTPEQYLQSKAFLNDYDLQKVVDSLGEEKLKAVLKYALGTIPISLAIKDD